MSDLFHERLQYQPAVPEILRRPLKAVLEEGRYRIPAPELEVLFPFTSTYPFIQFEEGEKERGPVKVGVVFSGGQAAGGHNVIWGLFDALPEGSTLFGFLDGPKGIVEHKYIELTAEAIAPYRNQGGFDLLGSGRTKIETPEQFQAALKTANNLELDGLVIIGGDDSNTNAALLAEYFLLKGCKTVVVGVPKTIDGDLRTEDVEISFGFDTAAKTYSEVIGNVARDALSAKKYYFFMKIMGRSASHLALECALQTHPNFTLIGEEVFERKKTYRQIISEITDMIVARAQKGKEYGVILVPEGIIEFIPEFNALIKELNRLPLGAEFKPEQLSDVYLTTLHTLPDFIQKQLLLDRDPHGNVKVSQIESERLLMEGVKGELKRRKSAVNFNPVPLFCGYEGRSGYPSNFDCQYGYALGRVAGLLLLEGCTAYMACVKNLAAPVEEWQIVGVPLTSMIHLEERKGQKRPVIKKALVDLNGPLFLEFLHHREDWMEDDYCYPGPIQFFGPPEITDIKVMTISQLFTL